MNLINRLRGNALFSGSATYLGANLINAAIPFALLPVLVRYLDPSEYGQVAMFQTVLGALGAFIGLNVVGSAGRKYYDIGIESEQMKYFIGSCIQITIASSIIVLLVVMAILNPLALWLSIEKDWLLIAVLVTTLTIISNIRLGQWQVRSESKKYGALQISQSAVNMLLSLALVVVYQMGAQGRIDAQVWSVIIFASISLFYLYRDKLLDFLSWRPDFIKEALSFGVPLIPHVAGLFLLASVDRFVINSQLGLSQVGVYMVAVQITLVLSILFDSVNKAYVPWLFERLKRDDDIEKRRIVLFTYSWFMVILSCVYIVYITGPWAIEIIAGEEYTEAGIIIGWLALGNGFGGMYLMVTNYIFYSKRTGLLSLVTLISGAINVALLVIMVRYYGIEGAAIAFSISMAIRFFFTWWVANKRYPMPWFKLRLQAHGLHSKIK